jgi:imidazolonepropionase-like amidohydrolase
VLPGPDRQPCPPDFDKAGIEGQLKDVSQGVADHAYEAAVNARKTLAAGFTTVRNLGDSDGVTLALRDAIAAGKLPGPRILDAAMPISPPRATWTRPGLSRGTARGPRHPPQHCNGADDCRRAVREQVAAAPT